MPMVIPVINRFIDIIEDRATFALVDYKLNT